MKLSRSLALLAASLIAGNLTAQEKIDVLIIDGQNNHNWKDTTPYLKEQLEKTGKFKVAVSTTPSSNPAKQPEDWANWNPRFEDFDVVLSNYNGPAWPKSIQKRFEQFIAGGGGLVNVHAANNAHNGWEEFEKMTGLLWRNAQGGWRVALDDSKNVVRVRPGSGRGAGHGPQHSFTMLVLDQEHPITRGMPIRWLHTRDELYHGQRGPAEKMNILAVAYSDKSKRGTSMYEPMVWWIPYGKGKVVTNVLGHVNRGDNRSGMPAMKCVGFVTLVQRSCEWAGRGKVSIDVPENFPNAEATSMINQ